MVGKLYEKCLKQSQSQMSFKDNMAFVGILSSQMLADQFIENFDTHAFRKVTEFKVWRDLSSTGANPAPVKN